MRALALDPGNTRSALVLFDDGVVVGSWLEPNDAILERIAAHGQFLDMMVIEKIESFGMAVGAEVFETVYWSGRFAERAMARGMVVIRLGRRAVKLHLCGQARAKDANIRQALIDRYGGKAAAFGTKKAPGPLYGVKADIWAALAVGVTFLDTTARVSGHSARQGNCTVESA